MFYRFASKLKFPFALRSYSRHGTTLLLKTNASVFNKRFIKLSSLAFASVCSFSFFHFSQVAHNFSSSSNIDSIDEIQSQCSTFGSKEEETQTIDYLKRHLES